MNKCRIISILLVGCAISACAFGQSGDDESMPDDDKKLGVSDLKVESVPTAVGEADAGAKAKGTGTIGPGLQRLVEKAREDLMAKTNMEEASIEVLEADYVTWANSSMGCPKPGYQYLQVLTTGSRILLKANNKIYHYHSGKDYPPFHCTTPGKEKPVPYAPGEA